MTFEELQKANESIQTMDIKGKDYAQVNQRIKAFRMVYPEGFIETKMLSNDGNTCVFYAKCGYLVDDRLLILGTGTAQEIRDSSPVNKTSYVENCETSAVGRALGMAGFGIDTSVASAEEVEAAMSQQKAMRAEIKAPQIGNDLQGFTDLKTRLIALGRSESEAKDELLRALGNPKDMTSEQYKRALTIGDTWISSLERGEDGEPEQSGD